MVALGRRQAKPRRQPGPDPRVLGPAVFTNNQAVLPDFGIAVLLGEGATEVPGSLFRGAGVLPGGAWADH
jgi:hypothetical protein